jgi:hypothetical protein
MEHDTQKASETQQEVVMAMKKDDDMHKET